jgi:Zn-dependent protease
MNAIDAVFYIGVLVMSVVIHEVSHGLAALYYGDRTAKHLGRLTLNPIPHLDLFGSILLPALLYLTNAGFMIGWAKPVPYNPDNLRDRKRGEIAVASAGVVANLLLSLIFGLILRFMPFEFLSPQIGFALSTIVLVNLALAIFNLVPIPPLDGSKILFGLLPASAYTFVSFVEQYSFVILIIFILFFSDILHPILSFLFSIITGYAL